jgi:hypothetical protein
MNEQLKQKLTERIPVESKKNLGENKETKKAYNEFCKERIKKNEKDFRKLLKIDFILGDEENCQDKEDYYAQVSEYVNSILLEDFVEASKRIKIIERFSKKADLDEKETEYKIGELTALLSDVWNIHPVSKKIDELFEKYKVTDASIEKLQIVSSILKAEAEKRLDKEMKEIEDIVGKDEIEKFNKKWKESRQELKN